MSKTYTLQATIKGGSRASWNSSYWDDYSLFANTGARCLVGKDGSTCLATLLLFDQATLAALRAKTVTSIILSLTVKSGTIPPSGAESYAVGYKYSSSAGSTSGSNAWARGDYNSSAMSTTAIGFIRTSGGSVSANYTPISIDLTAGGVPKYGYTIGPSRSNLNTYIELVASATLTVTTNEVDFYTVSYNAGGGSGAPAAQSKAPGVNLTLSSQVPTWTGYTFLGWNTKADGTGTSYNPGGTYSSDANATLYAIWQVTTYTVSFDANGGSGAPADQTKTYGQGLALSSTEPTKTGYTFSKWNTKADGTGTDYNPGDTYTGNADLTLYAIWEALTFTVTYDNNGHGTAPEAQTKSYNVDITLAAAITGVTGGTMTEWNTKADGTGTSYDPEDTYSGNADLTLYAIWTASTYTVTFDADGGSVDPATKTVTWGQKYGELPTPTITGETFYGWFDEDDVLITENSMCLLTGDITLTASWSIRSMVRVKGSDGLVTGAAYVKGSDGQMHMGICYVKGSDGQMHING